MLPDWVVNYVGGGVLAIVSYVIISNTLWLLLGSKLLKSLPGVNAYGATSTFRIAAMLVMSFIGILMWLLHLPFSVIKLVERASLQKYMSTYIQVASRIHYAITKRLKG